MEDHTLHATNTIYPNLNLFLRLPHSASREKVNVYHLVSSFGLTLEPVERVFIIH